MGSFQKEWLIYFYQAENYEYSDWLYFLRTGFKHCGGLTYNAEEINGYTLNLHTQVQSYHFYQKMK